MTITAQSLIAIAITAVVVPGAKYEKARHEAVVLRSIVVAGA